MTSLSRYSIDDSPYTTDILVEEGAAGITDIDAIVVMDGISDARVSSPHREQSIQLSPFTAKVAEMHLVDGISGWRRVGALPDSRAYHSHDCRQGGGQLVEQDVFIVWFVRLVPLRWFRLRHRCRYRCRLIPPVFFRFTFLPTPA